jgi:UPF0755 protein
VKRLALLLFLLLLLGAAGAAAFFLLAPSTPAVETFIDFPAGTGTRSMARTLQDKGILRSQYAFLLLRLWHGGSLKAGEYRFADAASAETVYRRIEHGDIYTRSVTIPEGFNLFDIAAAVQAAGLGTSDAFLQAARANTALIAAWNPSAPSLEGYLFPDTYRFSRHTPPRVMLEAMVRRFRTEVATLGLTGPIADTVTLASLVEKEVHFDDERALAAGVFRNRLDRGMPLQTDPTVVYAALLAHRWTGVIHRSDLDFSSPYNTYRHAGLPPGPICSPGAAALRAAMHPAETDKLYFVADAGGHTRFSAGLEEHEKAVESYRKSVH